MTDHANELRRYSRKIGHPAGDVPSVMLAAAEEIERLAARLEATEEDRSNFIVEMGKLCAQCDALRAKIAEMERQEPVAWMHETRRDSDVVTDAVKHVWGKVAVGSMAAYSIPLYTLPDAQTQPAPSVPDGWLRAIDEALVTAHIGVANAHDTYEQAKAKLDNLIGFHVDVATDPAVNGGFKLMPDSWEANLLIVEHAMRMNNWDWNSDTSDDLKRSAYKIISKLLVAPKSEGE